MTKNMQRVRGHAMEGQAPAYDDDGQPLPSLGRSKAAPGRGKCECGALSEPLPGGKARHEWHRQHKLDVLTVQVLNAGNERTT